MFPKVTLKFKKFYLQFKEKLNGNGNSLSKKSIVSGIEMKLISKSSSSRLGKVPAYDDFVLLRT